MGQTFLIIQTAFTGDAILATSLIEKLHDSIPGAEIDLLVRKGNESLFINHPFLREVLIWDKTKNKYGNLFRTLKTIREKKYDFLINLQRFFNTGFLTAFSSAREKIGYNKNPLSFLFSKNVKHYVKKGVHEIDRNQSLIAHLAPGLAARPRLYPSTNDFLKIQPLKNKKYITIAPGSVWFTKTFPAYKWIELISKYKSQNQDIQFYLIGSNGEYNLAETIRIKAGELNIQNFCGVFSYLESAALMKDAEMNYVNDSAPLHIASSMNAPVTAVYCSTVPDFGFGPLSDNSKIIETILPLYCRPCGLHGYRECPLTHFKCAHTIILAD